MENKQIFKSHEIRRALSESCLDKYFGLQVIENVFEGFNAIDIILDMQSAGVQQIAVTEKSSILFSFLCSMLEAGAKSVGRVLISKKARFAVDEDSYDTIEALLISIEG